MSRNTVILEPNQEWTFEVLNQDKLSVYLVEGKAEIFGTELAIGREYEFETIKSSVFTYFGCKLQWEGECVEKTLDCPGMLKVANIHFALESMRKKAEENNGNGPVLLVLGAENTGKTSLCKTLVSYATRMSRFPCLVNLDVQSPIYSPPGALTATPISHILDVEEFFGLPPINGPSLTRNKQSLVYTYALLNPNTSTDYFQNQMRLLAEGIQERQNKDSSIRTSGVIIDAPSSLLFSKQQLDYVLSSFKCTAIIVINKNKDNEILKTEDNSVSGIDEKVVISTEESNPQSDDNNSVKKDDEIVNESKIQESLDKHAESKMISEPLDLNFDNVETVYIDELPGVKRNDDVFLRQIQRRVIQEYFFGSNRRNLSPFTITTNLANLVVYRPLEQQEIAKNEDKSILLVKVIPSAVLQNCLLAVVDAEPTDDVKKIQNAETLGYIHVVEANEERSLIKILLPVPGKLPKNALIMGDVRYHE